MASRLTTQLARARGEGASGARIARIGLAISKAWAQSDSKRARADANRIQAIIVAAEEAVFGRPEGRGDTISPRKR